MASAFSDRLLAAWHEYERRQGRKVSGRELAALIGVSPPLLSQWMTAGANEPPASRVLATAAVCGVDPGWLMFGDETDAPMIRKEPAPVPVDAPELKSHSPLKTPEEIFGEAARKRRGRSK